MVAQDAGCGRSDATVIEAGGAHHSQLPFDELVALALPARQFEQLLGFDFRERMRAHAKKASATRRGTPAVLCALFASVELFILVSVALAPNVRARRAHLVSVITYARMATASAPIPAASLPEQLDPAVIGARVKALREASGLSLRDLTERSGVSAPMLSQVERGETSPTLTVAARIAAGLDLRLSQLLRLDETGAVTIVRASGRRRGGNKRRGHSFEVLTSADPGQRAELSRHTLAPGGATGAVDDPPMHEPGSRETAFVEHGAILLICDGIAHELNEGDCVTFDADLPHHFENPTTAEAAFLAVVSAGLRRS
jgi:XRE family transcriptional regulator, regulator of sulfur utilization